MGATHTATEPYGDDERPVPAPEGAGGVTWRAAVISLAIILLSVPAIFYGEVVWQRQAAWYGSGWSSGVPASWPLAVLLLLGVAGRLPVLRRFALTRRELFTVYSVVLVATPLLSIGVLFCALSLPISYYYFGQAYPQWEAVFVRLIPPWFSPSSSVAVEGYFLGGTAVPWSEWLIPSLAWSSFIAAIFLANLCLLSLVQRQWITHERLAFPLAQIPLESVASEEDQTVVHPGAHRTFWYGVLAAFLVTFVSSLSHQFPALPAFPLLVRVMSPEAVGPMAAFGQLDVALHPSLLAIAYLIPKDISFSIWFLWLVRLGLTMIAIAAGAEPMSSEGWWRYWFPAPYSQATGAVLAISASALWRSRRHLAQVFRRAFRREQNGTESAEPLRHRWALAGFVLCFAWLVCFLLLAGCRLPYALAYPTVIMGAYLSYARIQAEAAFDAAGWWFNDVMVAPVGGKRLLPREFIVLYTTVWVSPPPASFLVSACSINALTAFKIADSAGLSVRRLTRLLIGGFFVALIVGIVVILTGTYRIGFLGMEGGGGTGGLANDFLEFGDEIHGGIQQWGERYGADPSPLLMLYIGVGAVVCGLLAWLRVRLLWWPLHPVGYVLANSLPIAYGLLPVFIAWTAKALVTRYGGLRLYQWTVPIAIGLIVGDALNRSLWNVISLVTQGRL